MTPRSDDEGSDRSSDPEQITRPGVRRQKTRDSFRRINSIQNIKVKSEDPYAGIEVGQHLHDLFIVTNVIRQFMPV